MNNKIWTIIKREYLTRVRNKTFILSTFLTPILFATVIGIIVFITIKNSDKEMVAVIDSTGIFKTKTDSSKSVKYVLDPAIDTANYQKQGYTAVLYSPQTGINHTDKWMLFSRKNFGVIANEEVNNKIGREYENNVLLQEYKIGESQMDSLRSVAKKLKAEPYIGKGDKFEKGNSAVAYGLGYGAGFLIYITLFIYGAMVMRGVMEEKVNRIAEVVISSVKPFELMMGKIIGVGAVGLTQFLLWIVLLFTFSAIIGAFIPPDLLLQAQNASTQIPGGQPQASQAMINIAKANNELTTAVNWVLIISCFLFYFVFGYLFYAALFAAVGSAVNEDPQDAQSLMFPITMPIVIAIIIMINAITHPESSLATWSSMIPFFSPIVMMARIPFGVPGTVPWWQLGVSMILLIAGFLFTTWLSAKIYRTGILMYGKKATWKEMWKWAFRKN